MYFTFYFKREQERILVIAFKRPDEEQKVLVKEEFQDLEVHEILGEKSSVQSVITVMKIHRTIKINLTTEESKDYLGDKFGNLEIESTSSFVMPDENFSSSSNNSAEMMQMMKILTQAFTDLSSSLHNKKSQMKIDKFDGKTEDALSWIKCYEKACQVNGWITDSLKILNLKSNLEGIASKWFSSRIVEDKEEIWPEWKKSFIKAFSQNRIQLAIVADK